MLQVHQQARQARMLLIHEYPHDVVTCLAVSAARTVPDTLLRRGGERPPATGQQAAAGTATTWTGTTRRGTIGMVATGSGAAVGSTGSAAGPRPTGSGGAAARHEMNAGDAEQCHG